MDRDAAKRLIRSLTAADEVPTLDSDDLDDLVDFARAPAPDGALPTNETATAVWEASTAYLAGDTIRRAATGGYRYWRARYAGTSAATTPSFWSPPANADPARTATVVWDGSVLWEDAGGPWSPTWDINRAVARGWKIKAGKVAGAYDVGADGDNLARSQIHAHCLEQADSYRMSGGAATLTTSSARR